MRRKARLQKSLSRKKRGSRNRLKAKRALARFETKIARRRRDAQHKISHAMVAKHRVWAMEDCDFRAMTASACGTVEAPGRNVRQKAGLNRSLLDVAPGEVRRQVGYKAAWAGGALVKVPAAYTSQECSACHRRPGDAPETTHLANGRVSRDLFVCPLCGFRCDADVNAARTIRWRGVHALQRDGKIVAGSSGGQPEAACGALCAPLLREQAACGKTALPSRRWHGHEAGTASSRPKRGQFHAA
jgi:putative transposase